MSSSPLAKPANKPLPQRLSPEMAAVLGQPAIVCNRAFCVATVDGGVRLVFGEQLDDRTFLPRSAVTLGREAATQLADLIGRTLAAGQFT